MKSLIAKHLKALCALKEDDFSREILKPLFESMGYDRVDFNGGAYERGRDLIAQRRIPPKKEMYVAYVQSKKIGNIQNTANAAKLSTLLHQLRQCCLGKLTNFEGVKITPSVVYLACPEAISARLIEEIESQLFEMPVKVLPYDGLSIISDIKEYKPELLNKLNRIGDDFLVNYNFSLQNKELLSALKVKNEKCQNNFYNDLSFFVGSVDSNLLFHLELSILNKRLVIPENIWESFKLKLKYIEEKYNLTLIEDNVSKVEKVFIRNKNKYESKENKSLLERLHEIESEISNGDKSIYELRKTLKESLDANVNPLMKNISREELQERNNTLRSIKLNIEKFSSNWSGGIESDFGKDVDVIVSISMDKKKLNNELSVIRGKLIRRPIYEVVIDEKNIRYNLEAFKSRYLRDIGLINSHNINLIGLKKFLSDTEKTLLFLSMLQSDDFPLSKNMVFNKQRVDEDRVSISPLDVFSTGYDVAVYGGAGAGKTTTLKAYVDMISEDENNKVLYVPLNNLVDEFNVFLNEFENKDWLKKDLLIKLIVLSKGLKPTFENVENAKNYLSSGLTLILDGLDEVYDTIPSIIAAISEFKKNNSNVQFIISSRDCVSFLNDIEFLGITLLPFTQSQLKKFILGWFENNKTGLSLVDSIEDRNLYEHIKTPLLATITCTLVEKGINAPSTENEIYSERLRLLTGEYDRHKGIRRQKQNGSLLRTCAGKIALNMHRLGVRFLSKEKMLGVLEENLNEYYTNELLAACIEELINPCNVLIRNPITSKLSFGHFRFQEHLASEELKVNRNFDLSDLVIRDWWIGALCLYAQCNDMSYLIEEVWKKYGNIRLAKTGLESMIENSATSKRNHLKQLIINFEKSDEMDEATWHDNDNY